MTPEEQFDQAVKSYSQGNLGQAEKLLLDLDRHVPGHPEVQHLLGVIDFQSGRLAAAAQRLKEASRSKPDAPEVHDLLGVVLRRQGRNDAAIRSFRKALKVDRDFASAHYNLGNAYRDEKLFPDAAAHYGHAARLDPANANAAYNLGQCLFNLTRYEQAATAFGEAVKRAPQDAEAHVGLARTQMRLDNHAAAAAALSRARELAPDNVEILTLLNETLRRTSRHAEALKACEAGLALQSDSVELAVGKGAALQALGRQTEALECYRHAVSLTPENSDCQYLLASLLEMMNRTEEAKAICERHLPNHPDHVGLNCIAAKLQRRDGEIREAVSRLKAIPETTLRGSFAEAPLFYELGRLYNRLGRPGDAVESFTRANQVVAQDSDFVRQATSAALTYVHTLNDIYLDGSRVPDPQRGSDHQAPVFLIGFPRSGTTLLDQILGAHPDIQILEEEPTVSEVRNHLAKADPEYPAHILDIPDSDLPDLRRRYFDAVDAVIERRPGETLVDKIPFNTMEVGLLHRLFPDAKFIFAVRHPCDVCLSCFMQPFELNMMNANFTTLDDTVAFYEAVMRLWGTYREVLPIQVHQIRYEDLVDDLEGEARALLDFLELDWDAAVLDPAARARREAEIKTVSYDQVVEDIYDRAKYRWRTYERTLAPFLPRLAPFIKEFGYTDGDD